MQSIRPTLLLCLGALTLRSAPAGQTPSGTLVVTNMNDHTASILDLGTGRTLATLPTGQGPHEVAVSHDGRWAVVTNYGVRGQPGNSLTVIDLADPTVERTIDLGRYQRPHGVAFLPGDSTLLVTAEAAGRVLRIAFRSGAVLDSIPTRGRASHMLAVASSGTRWITANIVDGTISRFDGPGEPVVLPVARAVEGIAISSDGRTGWVGSNGDSLVVVMDLDRGVAIDTLDGFGMPYRLGVSPDGRSVVISDPIRGEIRIVDPASRRTRTVIAVPREGIVATAEVPGSPSPEGVALSADGRWAFVTLQGRNQVATIDLAEGRIAGYLPTGTWSDGVAWSPLAVRR